MVGLLLQQLVVVLLLLLEYVLLAELFATTPWVR